MVPTISKLKKLERGQRAQAGLRPLNCVEDYNNWVDEQGGYSRKENRFYLHPTKGWKSVRPQPKLPRGFRRA